MSISRWVASMYLAPATVSWSMRASTRRTMSSVSLADTASRFSSRCSMRVVPGIGSMLPRFASSHASASCAGVHPVLRKNFIQGRNDVFTNGLLIVRSYRVCSELF